MDKETETLTTPQLLAMTKRNLQKIAKSRRLEGFSSELNKKQLVQLLSNSKPYDKSPKSDLFPIYYDPDAIYTYSTPSPRSPISKSPSPGSPKENYMRKVGPLDNPEKYGIINELGSGNYAVTYRARNLDQTQDENKYYAIKIMRSTLDLVFNDWMKETICLVNIMDICTKVGILCYKDSFIFPNLDSKGNVESIEFMIVTELLEGYQTLNSFLYDETTMVPYRLTKKDAFRIYQSIVDIKNTLTDLCINHSDLHGENIMINPQTMDVKVIDLGRCQTPEEEILEWGYGTPEWEDYSDEARLKQIRRALYNAVKRSYHIHLQWPNDEPEKYFSSIIVNPFIPNCKRPSITPTIRNRLNNHINKYKKYF